jgi:hypothetical protein
MTLALVPEGPLTLDEVALRWPTLRQSMLAKFDDCGLSSLMSLRYERGWSTHPQAAGVIGHRVVADCLREMQRADSETVPVDVGIAILEEKLRQQGVPASERVRVPLRDIPLLEMSIRKFCADNAFTIRNLIDVERQLEAPITYRDANGELRTRIVTGRLDALLSRPPDEATVFDAKFTWALPPQHEPDDEQPGLSFLGFFQMVLYAYLVLTNFPAVMAVSTREFYPRRTKVREARIVRSDLPKITQRLSILVENLDAALAAGPPRTLKLADLDEGFWKPSPGRQCFNCAKAHLCPIDDDYKDGGIRTPEDAERAAGARQVALSVSKRLTGFLKAWVDEHGPVPVKRAKGRLVLGYRTIKGGKLLFSEYTPEGADRPATRQAYDPNSPLVEAMRASVAEARQQREGAT